MANEDGTVSESEAVADLLGEAAPTALLAEAAAEEFKLDTATTPTEEPEKEETVVTSLDPALKSLIDTKYGGDQAKFLQGIYEGWNSTTSIAKELHALRQKVEAVPERQPEPAELVPMVGVIEKQVTALDTRITRANEGRNQILLDANKINMEIARKQGEASRLSDAYDKASVEEQISRLEERKLSLQEKFNSYGEQLGDYEGQKSELQARLDEAVSYAESLRANRQSDAAESSKFRQTTLNEFVGAVEAEAQKLGIPSGSRAYNRMARAIHLETHAYLNSLGPEADAIDISAFVSARAKEYSEDVGLTSKQLAREKIQATTKAASPLSGPLSARVAAASKTSPAPKSAAEARAWAASVLGD
jgi:hypothetical protein